MIFIAPMSIDDSYGRLFKYMANVWLGYNKFGFDTVKYRWDSREIRIGRIGDMFRFVQDIQKRYGAQLIVVVVEDNMDVPFDAYYGADIALKYNTEIKAFQVWRNSFMLMDSTIFYSASEIANMLNVLMWGE